MLFPLPKQVKAKLEESEWFKISSKRSVNPDSRTVFNMYTLFCKRFGSINDPDAYLKAAELIEKLNEKAGEKIASIRQGLGSCRKSVRRCHQKSDASQDALKLVPDSSF